MVAEAPEGEEYIIIDVTAENLMSDSTFSFSSIIQLQIQDNEGYSYGFDFEGYVALKKAFKDGDILPGQKKRGEIAFLVPENSKLKLNFLFEISGTTAIFNL